MRPCSLLESLESRRLLAAAASAGLSRAAIASQLLDIDVNAARSASSATGWRETGSFGVRGLPAGATVSAVAGRKFDFARDAFARTLPTGTALRSVLLPTPEGGFARFAVQTTSLLAPKVARANPIHALRYE